MQSEEVILNLLGAYENKYEVLEELRKLSPEDELIALSNLIGFESIPVDIETFVKDDYFLGDIYGRTIYPIWMERLKQIFPDPIRTPYTFISAGGAIGVGKSFFSTIIMLYDYYKLSLIEDPYKFLNLAPNSPFAMRCFNVNLVKANEIFVSPISAALNASPYFNELHKRIGGYAHGMRFKAASQPRHILSEVCISAILSEINFFKYGQAEAIIDAVISRMESRMQLGKGIIGHVILDSSATSDDSAMTEFIKNSPYSNELISFSTSIWVAKSHLGIYFNNGSFRVYAGDSETPPFIFNDNHPIDESKLDKDRIIVCPNEVKNSFVSNIQLALQEKCGISLASIDNFIVDKETVKSKFDLPMVTDEIITVDFYDDETLWSVVGENILEVLPLDRRLYCRLDLGISHDLAGFSIAYFDGMKFVNGDTTKPVSTFKIPVAFDISRVRGQETPINKIRDFVLELSKFREIALITTDSYQSSQLRQEWNQSKLKASMLSVDRTDVPYKTWKMLLMENRCHVCANHKLRREVLTLKRVGNKIDHTAEGENSKDVSDACCGAVFSAYNQPQEAAIPSKIKKAEVLINVTEELRHLRKDRQVGRLNNRNFW